jgi:hypothetical protein
MPPFSPQTNPSRTPTRPPKRSFSSTSPASNWPISKKFCKQPDIKTKMSIPPLPPVQSDAALTIFIHSSLKTTVQNDRFGDSDRLAFIGGHVLSMAIAETLFEKRPMFSAVEVEVKCSWLPLIFKLCTWHSHMDSQGSRMLCRANLTTSGCPNTGCGRRLPVPPIFERS